HHPPACAGEQNLEAGTGIEPANNGFADHRLPAWLPGLHQTSWRNRTSLLRSSATPAVFPALLASGYERLQSPNTPTRGLKSLGLRSCNRHLSPASAQYTCRSTEARLPN